VVVLSLHMELVQGKEREAAEALLARTRAEEWTILRQWAAEITALGESAATGERMLVVPARPGELEAAVAALRLRVAGAE